jgi:hypothetical protein
MCEHGPQTVTRTCFHCKQAFEMVVDGEYVLQPWCDACLREHDRGERSAFHRQADEVFARR